MNSQSTNLEKPAKLPTAEIPAYVPEKFRWHWNKLQEMLSEEQSNIRQNLAGGAKNTGNDKSNMIDVAQDAEQIETGAQIAQIVSQKKLQIIKALERLKRGEYGKCLNPDCSNEISEVRLKAVPEAPFCKDCQIKNEPDSQQIAPRKSLLLAKKGGRLRSF